MSKLLVEKIGGAGSGSVAAIQANIARLSKVKPPFILVVSAPGGPAGRITDELIRLTELHAAKRPLSRQISKLRARFNSLAAPFAATELAEGTIKEIEASLGSKLGYSYSVRQGDDFTAKLYAQLLQAAGQPAKYVDILKAMQLNPHGRINVDITYKRLFDLLKDNEVSVVSGHPGLEVSGRVAEVSLHRGYTDVTGMAVAASFDRAGYAVTYELSKEDVNGVLRANPSLVKDPGTMPTINVAELETMSIGGAQVVKTEVANLLEPTGVKLLVHNPKQTAPGTVVVSNRPVRGSELAGGIANKPVVEIKLNQRNIDNQPGIIADFAKIFKDLKIAILEAVTTSGSMTFYIALPIFKHNQAALKSAIAKFGYESAVEFAERAMVVLVGEALRNDAKTMQAFERIMKAAHKHRPALNIVSFWNNDKEPSIYIVVPKSQEAAFVNLLYKVFFS